MGCSLDPKPSVSLSTSDQPPPGHQPPLQLYHQPKPHLLRQLSHQLRRPTSSPPTSSQSPLVVVVSSSWSSSLLSSALSPLAEAARVTRARREMSLRLRTQCTMTQPKPTPETSQTRDKIKKTVVFTTSQPLIPPLPKTTKKIQCTNPTKMSSTHLTSVVDTLTSNQTMQNLMKKVTTTKKKMTKTMKTNKRFI